MNDEIARLFKNSPACMACPSNPAAEALIKELVRPGSGPAPSSFLGALLSVSTPEYLSGAYDVRIRFIVNRGDMNRDPVGIIYDGVRRALRCFYGPGALRARLSQQRTPQHPTLPLPKSSGGKRGGP